VREGPQKNFYHIIRMVDARMWREEPSQDFHRLPDFAVRIIFVNFVFAA